MSNPNMSKNRGHQETECYGCVHATPFFKYRKCLHTVCPKGKVSNVFRKRPLSEDVLSMRGYTLPLYKAVKR